MDRINIITLSEYIPGRDDLNVRCLCATPDVSKAIRLYSMQKMMVRYHLEKSGNNQNIKEDETELNDAECEYKVSKGQHIIVLRFTKQPVRG